MSQEVAVNGTVFNNPINAVSLGPGESAVMTPTENIEVFLTSSISGSVVFEKTPEDRISIEFGDECHVRIAYDSAKHNGFYYPSTE